MVNRCFQSFAKVTILLLFLLDFGRISCQKSLDYYLPSIPFSQNITTPEDFLNYQIGEWHITHDQLYYYLKQICEESPQCILEEYARSHENKPLINLIISNSENIKNIDNIRKAHNQLVDPRLKININISSLPLVLYQGYSIHGNESSGANAAVLNAYYLLAGQSEHLSALLNNVVIVLDPCYNPDGLQRFSTWANSHKHLTLNTDPKDREFNEIWPGGRTNHYWFDLNRDWLFNVHPSSKGRIESFHKWKPDVLTDHHEMGSNSTFFFQPGIPSRTNPNTPQINQDLTEEIGVYHAQFLDSIGSSYFTKERFDDFYYGKGSTYPDINGCIGILFEQASSRGHLRETTNGLLSFPFTIRNQVVTSLSTQKAALDMKDEILRYKRDFYKNRFEDKSIEGYYVFEEKDAFKANFFLEILKRHQINVYKSSEDIKLENQMFSSEDSYVIPKKQYQTSLIKTIFERVNNFNDSLFYDVSAWTLPLAFNIKYGESQMSASLKKLTKVEVPVKKEVKTLHINENTIAVAFDWSNYNAPAFLSDVLSKDIKVEAMDGYSVFKSDGESIKLKPGTLVIKLSQQEMVRKKVAEVLVQLQKKHGLLAFALDSGYSDSSFSLGSNKLVKIDAPNVAMLVGEGVNAYEAGDIWYQMDQRFKMKFTKLDIQELGNTNLNRYNIIIMPDGRYRQLDAQSDKLREWVLKGGTLICFRGAINYARKNSWIKDLEEKSVENLNQNDETSYVNYGNTRGAQIIGGAIFETEINPDHPLLYGYDQEKLPVFKKGTQFYSTDKKSATPMIYSQAPLMSGYASDENQDRAKGAAALICSAYGSGQIISCVDNPNFRGYWIGGSHLFANMLFMSKLIDRNTMIR